MIEVDGPERAHFLLEPRDGRRPRESPADGEFPTRPSTDRSAIRWNALAIVLRANKESSELGGHIASFQSAATLYDTGFMHFWRAPSAEHGGDLVYIQGHSSPGIYARALLEGRVTEEEKSRKCKVEQPTAPLGDHAAPLRFMRHTGDCGRRHPQRLSTGLRKVVERNEL